VTNPNDPAFLVKTVNADGTPRPCGLTKREYFAAMSMQGLNAHPEDWSAENTARYAVEQADALIAALNKEVEK